MVAFHIVLRNNAVVLDSGFIQEVCGVGLLKKSITDVFFISKNLVDGAGPPFCFASAGEDAVCFQTFCNPVHRVALQVFTVDALYHLRLLWIDDEIPICILGVAEEVIVIYLYLAILVAKLESQLYILAEGLRFLLSQGSHNRNQDLTLGIHCVDGFLFEEDGNVLILQLADVFQAVQRVAGKSADGLGDYKVDFLCFTIFD